MEDHPFFMMAFYVAIIAASESELNELCGTWDVPEEDRKEWLTLAVHYFDGGCACVVEFAYNPKDAALDIAMKARKTLEALLREKLGRTIELELGQLNSCVGGLREESVVH